MCSIVLFSLHKCNHGLHVCDLCVVSGKDLGSGRPIMCKPGTMLLNHLLKTTLLKDVTVVATEIKAKLEVHHTQICM